MRRLESGDDPLGPRQQLDRVECFLIRNRVVPGEPGVVEVGVLRPHPRVVEPGRYRVGLLYLAVSVLEHVGAAAVEHPGRPGPDRGAVPTRLDPLAARLHPDEFDPGPCEGMEHPHGVGAAADAGHHDVGKLAVELPERLLADHLLELAHHPRKRVGPNHGADDVVSVLNGAHPIAHGLADCVLEGAGSRRHRDHLRSEQPHPQHIERLPLDVDHTHVHRALQPESGCGGCCGDAVLSGAGFGDHPRLSHSGSQQSLADGIVDLVGPGVGQVLAFEQDAHPKLRRQPLGGMERGGPADELGEPAVILGHELGVAPGRLEVAFQIGQCRHQRLRREPPAVLTEPAGVIGAIQLGWGS